MTPRESGHEWSDDPVPGGIERRSAFGRQINDAAHDENSVVFTRKQQPRFERRIVKRVT